MSFAIDSLRLEVVFYEKRLRMLGLSSDFITSKAGADRLHKEQHYAETRIAELRVAIDQLEEYLSRSRRTHW